MFAISSPSKSKADEILEPVKINGISCKMELDTEASVTLIHRRRNVGKELRSVPLVESSVTLKSYSGHAVPVVGETTVHVQYQTLQVNLPIVVIKGLLYFAKRNHCETKPLRNHCETKPLRNEISNAVLH